MDKFRAANEEIKIVVARYDHVTYADIDPVTTGSDGKPRREFFIEDDLHLTEEGYAAWTAVVKPLVEAAQARYRKVKMGDG